MGQGSGVDMGILRAVQEVNEHQKRLLGRRLVERFGTDLRGHAFAVWGLAFKPETDDLREAPSLVLIEELLARGASVRAFDPVAMPAMRARMGERPGLTLVADPMEAAQGADALVVVTEWRQFRSPDFAGLRKALRTPVIVDGRNLYDPALVRQLGFEHVAVGRGAHPAGLPALDGAPLSALAA
jgi:UDPglucose 6-dehydrogenase